MNTIGNLYYIKNGKIECKEMLLSDKNLKVQKVNGNNGAIKLYSDDEMNKVGKKDFHLYDEELSNNITVVRKVNKAMNDLGDIIILEDFYVDIYIPKNVTILDFNALDNVLKQFDRDKNLFGITNIRDNDFDFYDWNYNRFMTDSDVSLICSYYYREKLGLLNEEEKEMFSKYRTFDIKKLILDDFRRYPLNNNNIGIILLTENKNIEKTGIKSNHKNEIISEIQKLGNLPKNLNYINLVNLYNLVLILISKDSIIGYVNGNINDYQKMLLWKIINEIEELKLKRNDLFCGCNVILNGNIIYSGGFEKLKDVLHFEPENELEKISNKFNRI